jgi:(S)-2-hydroxyglutarate dehydrogenase
VVKEAESRWDLIVIGGGIVGLSSALQLQQRFLDRRVLLLEKESDLARHQTGRNSGVIHAGIYYPPESLKAKFCREGLQKTVAFCQRHQIPFQQCGKLLVATNDLEYRRMLQLYERAQTNGLQVELLDQEQLRQREPNVSGVGAIYLQDTGIVDYRQVCRAIAQEFIEAGGVIKLQAEVVALSENSESVSVQLSSGDVLTAGFLVSCGGLMADRLVDLMGIERNFQIIPFRGEYYRLNPRHNQLVQQLIYPIPDPELPFLGVHLTRMIDGSVTVGPNAVLGWQKEGYGTLNVSIRDTVEMLGFKGFWKLLPGYLKPGVREWFNAWWRRGYLKQVQKYCPSVRLSDLQPYPAGVRAQAVLDDGSLVHDFLFKQSRRSLHVCNAPSPAATSAFPIGVYTCDRVEEQLTADS